MDAALAGSALLMGLAGSPHCVAMCGAACAALGGGASGAQGSGLLMRPAMLSLQAGRLLSYSLGGAVAASSVSMLAYWGQAAAWLRPFWVMLHLAALGLGLFLLRRGRQPQWLDGLGRGRSPSAANTASVAIVGLRGGQRAVSAPARAGLAGLAWLAWPCGLLQSALVVAALASGPAQGAAVMACFALGSALGLLVGPAALWRLLRLGQLDEARGYAWAVRLAGLGLLLSSGWALGHGIWAQIAAFCS
ncbi:sulfite exporter TauE/SafE family protein [Paucibacter sp. APW11]|uniref:Sulfite exporter TauE/SafE family protein n=1 Tax=Roseateles aquae TaxID=3077235 RepID=A0ABU3P9C2_9BURK|nr:sulfite exporter TauE/SafE family protein [Paucibacter sp. APW11]MDT8999168.1 sulfite exporter TauE/SafE family protein [Paucibacter sp. APW11]